MRVKCLALLVVAVLVGGCSAQLDDRYVEIGHAPIAVTTVLAGPDASTGSFTTHCGNNAERHLNADNAVISPGIPFGAHHTHEYVGNLTTNAFSDERSLAAAGTSCADGDLSAYFWPVLRLTDGVALDAHAEGGGLHGNTGEILAPRSVAIRFTGSPVGKVVPMPRFLRMITGDPSALTSGGVNARAQWGCTGYPDRRTPKYPLCPDGSLLTRTFEFPSCWDGRNVDSASHRAHAVFPGDNGVCPAATFSMPLLRMVIEYAVAEGRPFAIDSFPDEHRDPSTDHAMFVNVLPDAMMTQLTACLNEGRDCG